MAAWLLLLAVALLPLFNDSIALAFSIDHVVLVYLVAIHLMPDKTITQSPSGALPPVSSVKQEKQI